MNAVTTINENNKKSELLIGRYTFYDFPISIKVGDVKPQYYHKDRGIPKSIERDIDVLYEFDDENFLCMIHSGERVLKNKTAYDKGAKYMAINGNMLFEMTYARTALNISYVQLIKRTLTTYFRQHIRKLPIQADDYPLTIYFQYHLPESDIDIDNFTVFYQKAFLDAFQTSYVKGKNDKQVYNNTNGSIPNDSLKFITRISHEVIVNPELKKRKLHIAISRNNKKTQTKHEVS